MLALSESVMKNILQRPYLGNHASQIKVTMDHYHEVLVAYKFFFYKKTANINFKKLISL